MGSRPARRVTRLTLAGALAFSRLLEDAEKHKLITLSRDARSGTYVVTEVLEEGL